MTDKDDDLLVFIQEDTPQKRINVLDGIVSPLNKVLLARRQALLMELGAIEEYLGMDRSVIPKHKR